ncbi:hypothetical protein ACM41_05490 [Bradyrhizobium sp. CCBAU 21362]|nr:hypothetical protein [Bradyrhizobium sp. CCBAU 21362]
MIQDVREKLFCPACEAISQPLPRTQLRVDVLDRSSSLMSFCSPKYRLHLPLNRQSDVYHREGVDRDPPDLRGRTVFRRLMRALAFVKFDPSAIPALVSWSSGLWSQHHDAHLARQLLQALKIDATPSAIEQDIVSRSR